MHPAHPKRIRHALGATGHRLAQRFPLIIEIIQSVKHHGVVDRAAALAMYTMLAAVPLLLATFSVFGFLLGAVDRAGDVTGLDLELRHTALRQLVNWVREALPGVTWNPAVFAAALVRHRAVHGIVGILAAVFLGSTVFGRLDEAIRLIFGRKRRSTLRAAGYMGGVIALAVALALVMNFVGPLIEWGLHVAAGSVHSLSKGWIDGVALAMVLSQSLPVAGLFFVLVRWSVGRIGMRRLAATSLIFGILCTIGQWLFTLYGKSVVQMDAVYGALSGVVALLLWLFYANLALMVTVFTVASLERRANAPKAEKPGPGHTNRPVAAELVVESAAPGIVARDDVGSDRPQLANPIE